MIEIDILFHFSIKKRAFRNQKKYRKATRICINDVLGYAVFTLYVSGRLVNDINK
jgi:hypothetical protein